MNVGLLPLDAAKVVLSKSCFDEAVRLLAPLDEVDPNDNAAFLMAWAELGLGAADRAANHLMQFRLRKPQHAGALLVQVRIQYAQGKGALALDSARSAIEARPDFSAACSLIDEITAAEILESARSAVALIDASYSAARIGGPTPELLKAAADLAALPRVDGWTRNIYADKIAYFQNASDLSAALRYYDAYLIEVSCEFDHISWPKRNQDYVGGKSVIDVGCSFDMDYLVAAATSYFRLDPILGLDSTLAKRKRTRTRSDIGITPLDIANTLPAIRLQEGSSEDVNLVETFGAVSFHNVTEHLLQLDLVFKGLGAFCGPDTRVVFLHHNFCCWNGHHLLPIQPAQLDVDNIDHQMVYDWRHTDLLSSLPDDHYFKTHLNRIRLDEICAITDRHFDIEKWDEVPSNAATLARLTTDVMQRVRRTIPDIQERELTANVVFCVARLRTDAAAKPASKARKPKKSKA